MVTCFKRKLVTTSELSIKLAPNSQSRYICMKSCPSLRTQLTNLLSSYCITKCGIRNPFFCLKKGVSWTLSSLSNNIVSNI